MISYLAALPSRDPVAARNQQITHEWWDTRRMDYELRTSRIVITEAEGGDPIYARRRRALLEGVAELTAGEDVDRLAMALLTSVPLPPKALADAAHIAIASLRGVEYVLTWNFKHIANPRLQLRIQQVLSAAGVLKPVLCTPADLMRGRRFPNRK